MTGKLTVHTLDVMTEATWSFRDSQPTWKSGTFGSSGTFDPFPAYRHLMEPIEETAALVAEKVPPVWDVSLYVADREEVGRSNGFSNVSDGGKYEGNKWVKGPPSGIIVLSGKRVQPHPAVSRYLVAHEYGHHVEWFLNVARGHGLHSDGVVADYAKYRGLSEESVHHGSGGRWHDSVTEIFACDFRVIVCNVETSYWPHPGIPHSRDRSLPRDLYGWWAQALDELKKWEPNWAEAE